LGNRGERFWELGEGVSTGKFIWTEAAVIVLAIVGAARGIVGRGKTYDGRFALFLACYGAVQFVAYSLISYKTPWCILSAHHAFLLLAGFGAAGLFTTSLHVVVRGVAVLLALLSVLHLALQSYRANFPDARDGWSFLRTGDYYNRSANPYAYGFTPNSVLNLIEKIDSFAAKHPQGKSGLQISIASPGFGWPLPWYLRHYPRVELSPAVLASGHYPAIHPSADLYLVDPKLVLDLPLEVRGAENKGSKHYSGALQGPFNQQYWYQGFVRRTLADLPPATP
jgi:hypothetical protein